MYRIEDKASAIKEIQRLLKINESGFYDTVTRDKVKDTQKQNGIEQTGIVDYTTFVKIVNDHKRSSDKIWNSNYLFLPDFPYRTTNIGSNITRINDALKIVLKDYRYDGIIPAGGYFGNDTVNAIRFLRKVFMLDDSDEIDEELMNRILYEIRGIELKNIYG